MYIYIDFSGKIWQSTVIFAGMRYGLLYDMMINIFYFFSQIFFSKNTDVLGHLYKFCFTSHHMPVGQLVCTAVLPLVTRGYKF